MLRRTAPALIASSGLVLALAGGPATVRAQAPVGLGAASHAVGVLQPGERVVSRSFVVDDVSTVAFVLVSSTAYAVAVETPDGSTVTPANAAAHLAQFDAVSLLDPRQLPLPGFGIGEHQRIVFHAPQPGRYTLMLDAGAPVAEPTPFAITVLPESALRVGVGIPQAEVFTGTPVVVNAFVFEGSAPVLGATATAAITRDVFAGGEPPPPATLVLGDDGADADAVANDGVYSGALPAPVPGRHMVVARVTGTSSTGRAFQRHATAVFEVSDPGPTLDPAAFGSTLVDDNGNGLGDRLRLRVGFDVPAAGLYRLGLIVRASNGRTIAGTAIGTLATGAQTLDVHFPAARVRTLGVDATAADPYTITLLRLDELRDGERILRLREIDRIGVAGIALGALERGAIELTGAATAAGVDTDGDGRFDRLHVELGVDLLGGGVYEWSASLIDGSGREIGFDDGRDTLGVGAQTIALDFDGCAIGASGAAAPLGVRGLLMFGAGRSLVLGAVVASFDFSAGQFECGTPGTTTTSTATTTSATTSTVPSTTTSTSTSTTTSAPTSTTTSTTRPATTTTTRPTTTTTTTTTLPPAGPFEVGDVFVGVSRGRIHRYDASGMLRDVLETGQPDAGSRYGGSSPPNATAGCGFDAAGSLYVANYGPSTVSKFDRQGALVGTFASGVGDQPAGLVLDGRGNVYVGTSFGDRDLRKFGPDGTALARLDVGRGVAFGDKGWIDLAPDQCTMLYTSEVADRCAVKRYDVCRDVQLADFFCPHPSDRTAVSPTFEALRLLPDGGILLAGQHGIVRLAAGGAWVQFYDVLGHRYWTGIALAPDGRSFWAASFDTSAIFQFDLQSGAVLRGPIATGTERESLVGVCVFGEATAAREHACDGGIDEDGDGSIDCADPDCAIHAPCDPTVTTTTSTSSTTTTLPPASPPVRDHAGTDFVLGFIQNDDGSGPIVRLYLQSKVATEVTVEYPFHPPSRYQQSGIQFSTRVAVTPGSATVVAIPGEAVSGWLPTPRNNLVHAFGPDEFSVVMVTINERGLTGFAGSALALPVDALGTEYVVTTYDGDGFDSRAQFVVAAAFDDTSVTITPTGTALPGLPAGLPRVFHLDRGEGLRIQAALSTLDLTGTTIVADKPIGVTTGNGAAFVGTGNNLDFDHMFEVAQPVEHWGRDVLVADRPSSPFGSVYRVVAAADDTTVMLDGTPAGTIDRGQFIDTGLVLGDHRFTADRPVFVTQFHTGGGDFFSDARGDPSMANMPPIAQYASEHTFVAVHENQFHDAWVTVIAESTDVGTITFDGTPMDPAVFRPIAGTCFSVARVPLTRGSHTTRSHGVHGVTVEGFAVVSIGSHLYPAGATFQSTEPACGTTPPACRCDTPTSTSTTSTTAPTTTSSTAVSIPTTSTPPTSVSTSTSTSTSTTTSSSSTTTIPRGCSDETTFTSIRCRIDALIADVTTRGLPEPIRSNMLRHLGNARRAVDRAQDRADAGREHGAHTRLKSAARKMRSFAFRVRSQAGKKAIAGSTASDYRARSDGIEVDCLALARTFPP